MIVWLWLAFPALLLLSWLLGHWLSACEEVERELKKAELKLAANEVLIRRPSKEQWQNYAVAIAARADQQNAWMAAGDIRGLYGPDCKVKDLDTGYEVYGWPNYMLTSPEEVVTYPYTFWHRSCASKPVDSAGGPTEESSPAGGGNNP